jgi:hypothetical protein
MEPLPFHITGTIIVAKNHEIRKQKLKKAEIFRGTQEVPAADTPIDLQASWIVIGRSTESAAAENLLVKMH